VRFVDLDEAGREAAGFDKVLGDTTLAASTTASGIGSVDRRWLTATARPYRTRRAGVPTTLPLVAVEAVHRGRNAGRASISPTDQVAPENQRHLSYGVGLIADGNRTCQGGA
jgi:hypothetical protein